MTNRLLIFASAGLRAIAVGLTGVILAMHLAAIGFHAAAIGLAVSLGLAGCAAGTLIVAYVSDHWGRRATAVGLAFLMGSGGLVFAFVQEPSFLILAAFFGMVNGMGRDRGAGVTVEQAMLPKTTTPAGRTSAFAWYNVTVDLGHSLGALLSGLPAFLRSRLGFQLLPSYQAAWIFYSLICFTGGILASRISKRVELDGQSKPSFRLSDSSRPLVMKFAALAGLDSLGGGFLTSAILSYWFFSRYGVDEGLLGPFFFIIRIANGISHLVSARIARRIGLIRTMVFTHIPSSLLLMAVPFAPTLQVAILLSVLREFLVEMDVATRQSYIVAIVGEHESTRAAGITNVTRSVAWAVTPIVAGSLMKVLSLSAPLFIGPAIKITYDLLLYREFRHIRPPEER